MTYFQNDKSDERTKYLFYFSLDRSKITPKSMQEILQDYKFKKNRKLKRESFDLVMMINLEANYNASKFANDLIKEYPNLIMEIKVKPDES